MKPRLLVVVAHPDDETFGGGSVLLHAAANGAETFVCCATRGEAGEPAPGSGVTTAELPEVRERELHTAADILGVTDVRLLDYRDSGMDGDPAANALVAAPVGEVAAAVAAMIDEVHPHVVVTLDAADGHRDHVHIRDATLAAVQAAGWRVERVYLHCLVRSAMRQWADHMRDVNPDSPYLDVEELGLGTPDQDITTVIESAAHLDTRWAAIRAHASQTSPFEALPDQVAALFLAVDQLQRVIPPWDGGPRETEIFPH